MDDVDRRRFLRHARDVVAVATVGGSLPPLSVDLPVSSELLDWARDDLTRLRRLDSAKGVAASGRETLRHADHLTRMLRTTPDGPLRRRIAALAGEASELASIVAGELNQPQGAIAWAGAAMAAGKVARDPDLFAAGLVEQATRLNRMGHPQMAIERFECLPRSRLSPMVTAYAEARRANVLAHAGPQYQTASQRALDRATNAAQAAAPDETPPWMYVFSQTKVDLRRAYSYIPLGFAEDAYALLRQVQRGQPRSMIRIGGGIHLNMARAAVGMGDIERACHHTGQAFEVFQATSPRQLEKTRKFATELSTSYDAAAVRELQERIRADYQPPRDQPDGGEAKQPRRKVGGARYVQVRSAHVNDGRWMLHKEDCLSALRANRSYPWPKGNRRTPQHLANDPAVRAKNVPCAVCIGRLWV